MKTICSRCDNEMELLQETVNHTLGKRDITVHNVPMYKCTSCDNSFYVMSKKLEQRLEEAYMRNKTEIFFEGE